MARPDTLLTRCRRRLAALIEPGPDQGEMWCLGCALNDGRTRILPADSYQRHALEHVDPTHAATIIVAWPPRRGPGSETAHDR
jgi:hypothetical protein